MKDKKLKNLILAMMSLISIGVSLVIFLDTNKPDYYATYFLMPFSYNILLFCMLPWSRKLFKSVSFTLTIGLYFAKFVIVPLLTCLGEYSSFLINEEALNYMNKAILLSCYELFVVSIGLHFFYHIAFKLKKERCYIGNKIKSEGFDGFDSMIMIGTFMVLCILIIYPSLLQNFHLATQIGTAQDPVIELRSWRTLGTVSKVPLGIVNTLMLSIFGIIHLMLPIVLLEKIKINIKNQGIAVFLSVLIILGASMIMTEANAITIFIAFSLLVLVLNLYLKFTRKYAWAIVVTCGGIILLLFAQKVGGSSDFGENAVIWQKISTTLNAYLNGPINLSVAFLVKKNYNLLLPLTETLAQFPIGNRLFEQYSSSILFNEAFWGITGRTDQLLPGVGQGLLYFGWVIAPIIPLFFAIVSASFETAAQRSINIKVKGLMYFGSVISAFLIGNNMSHFLSYLFKYFPIYILLYFMRYRVVVHEKRKYEKLGGD